VVLLSENARVNDLRQGIRAKFLSLFLVAAHSLPVASAPFAPLLQVIAALSSAAGVIV
jgi:hypothetical protein